MRKFLTLLIFFFLLSCQKDSNPISQNQIEIIFPETPGTTWNYSFVDTTFYIYQRDSMMVETDTLHVQIVSNQILPNEKKEVIWRLESKNFIDSLMLTYSGDTIFVAESKEKYFTNFFVLLLPLNDGEKWKYSACDYEVSFIDNLQLSSGTVNNLYKVRQLLKRVGNSGGENIVYLKNGIGIVKYVHGFWTTMGETNHRKVWQLLDYSVVQ